MTDTQTPTEDRTKYYPQTVDDLVRELPDEIFDVANIDPLQLQREFAQLPALMAYWNERMSQSIAAHLTSKAEREAEMGMADMRVRDQLATAAAEAKANGTTVPKVTEAAVRANIELDEGYLARRSAEIAAEVEKLRIRGLCDTIKTKASMLISLGAHIRAEMSGDPSVKAADRWMENYDGAPAEPDFPPDFDV